MKETIQSDTPTTAELTEALFELKATEIWFEIEYDDSLTEPSPDSEVSTYQEEQEDYEIELVKVQNRNMSLWNEILQ